jgi:hypothetical protein
MFSSSTIRTMQEEAAVRAARERRIPFVYWPGDNLTEGGFPFPNLGDYVPTGWRRLTTAETGLTHHDLPGTRDFENVVVLVSSMGDEDRGRALGVVGLRALIERINVWAAETRNTVGWAIVEVGQFQVVVSAFAKEIPEGELRALDGNR